MKKNILFLFIIIITALLFNYRFKKFSTHKNKNEVNININGEETKLLYKNEQEKDDINIGLMYYKESNYPKAIELLKNINGAEKILLDAYKGSAVTNLNESNFEKAYNDIYYALELDKNNPEINFLMGYYYFTINEYHKAQNYLEYVYNNYKDSFSNPLLRLSLMQIYYYEDQLDRASKLIDEVREEGLSNPDIQFWMKKIEDDIAVEQSFTSSKTEHFIVKYNAGTLNLLGSKMINILEKIYPIVSRKMKISAQNRIVVIFYLEKDFKSLTDSPAWVGGIFDGKIRIPAGGNFVDTKELTQILKHELTHALIYQKVKYNIPTWFNEGIAQYMEYYHEEDNLWAARENSIQAFHVQDLKLKNLEGNFLSMPKELAILAYNKSFSVVHYMIFQYDFNSIVNILDNFENGYYGEKAFQKPLHIENYDALEKEWVEWKERQ